MADFQSYEWLRNNVSINGINAQSVSNQSIYLENLNTIKNNILNFNIQADNLFSSTDAYIKSSLKDPDKNIEYFKVLSQLDYNITKPDNNTLYFINNIEEPINQLGLILDMVADDKAIWVLTYQQDTSLEVEARNQVILWKSAVINKVITTTSFNKIKTWNGFKDGRLTLDGRWIFDIEDEFEPYLETSDEPFVALISEEDELYGFPSLRFERAPRTWPRSVSSNSTSKVISGLTSTAPAAPSTILTALSPASSTPTASSGHFPFRRARLTSTRILSKILVTGYNRLQL